MDGDWVCLWRQLLVWRGLVWELSFAFCWDDISCEKRSNNGCESIPYLMPLILVGNNSKQDKRSLVMILMDGKLTDILLRFRF